MRHTFRLFWRTARFEIVVAALISATYTVAVLVLAGQMRGLVVAACGGPPPCADQSYLTPDWTALDVGFGEPAMFGASGLALVFGLLFGPSLVADDLERGRLHLVWSLVRSRPAWLLWRVLPALLAVALFAIGPAIAADQLEAVHAPQLDPTLSFHDFGSRGALLVMHAVLVFAIGVVVGAVTGRVVPALVTTAAIAMVALALLTVVRVDWLPRESVPRDVINELTSEEPLPIGEGFELPDGRLLTYDESQPLRPATAQAVDSPGYDNWLPTSGWQRVFIGIRGFEEGAIALREALISVVLSAAALIAAAVGVRRRRPVAGNGFQRANDMSAAAKPVAGVSPRRRSALGLTLLLATRVSRPEVLGAVAATAGATLISLAVLVAYIVARASGHCADSDCIGAAGEGFVAVSNFESVWLDPLAAVLPFVLGALLGAPIVARELESGSGRLAFSLSSARTHWLLCRLLPIVGLTLVLLVPISLVSQQDWQERVLLDPWASLPYFWLRGPTLIARGLAALGLGVLAGVFARRVLGALVLAGLAGLLLYNTLDAAIYVPLWTIPWRFRLRHPNCRKAQSASGRAWRRLPRTGRSTSTPTCGGRTGSQPRATTMPTAHG